MAHNARKRYPHVLCLKNRGYPASLEVGRVYSVLPDAQASRQGLIRVVDESGEDYLYPEEWFKRIALSSPEHRLIYRSAPLGKPVAAAVRTVRRKG